MGGSTKDIIHTKHTDVIARETLLLELKPLSKAECRFESVFFLNITTSCPRFLWTYCIFDIGKNGLHNRAIAETGDTMIRRSCILRLTFDFAY